MWGLFVGAHAKRMSAGILGYVLPTHNPVRVAEEIATLDHMLRGRLIVGFTRGYHARWVDSYAAVRGTGATNVLHAKAKNEQDAVNREIFEESVHVVKKAWENSVFSHKGKYWEFPPEGGSAGHPGYAEFGKGMDENGVVREIGIAPRPFQNPHPKLYGAFAYSMRTVDMWAREGGKQVVFATDLDFCEALWNRYSETAKKAGRDVPREDIGAWGGFLILTDDREQAARLEAEHRWFWDKWFIPHGQQFPNVLIGTADDISRQIEQAHDRLGFDECFLMFGQGHLEPGRNEDELARFAEEVAPRFATKDAEGTLS
jgi:alkanesulfonate monooxygenase SsuD/methylene tetrahydromethanopterin reductase-like flavin-dependent oxidoreductase (luciferase family)